MECLPTKILLSHRTGSKIRLSTLDGAFKGAYSADNSWVYSDADHLSHFTGMYIQRVDCNFPSIRVMPKDCSITAQQTQLFQGYGLTPFFIP